MLKSAVSWRSLFWVPQDTNFDNLLKALYEDVESFEAEVRQLDCSFVSD